jgi:hypothetical protein
MNARIANINSISLFESKTKLFFHSSTTGAFHHSLLKLLRLIVCKRAKDNRSDQLPHKNKFPTSLSSSPQATAISPYVAFNPVNREGHKNLDIRQPYDEATRQA